MDDIKRMTASQLIRRHWDRQPSLPRHGGAEPPAIAAFESRHAVVLPTDFHSYVHELNGLPEAKTREGWDNVDSEGFEFLPLALLRPTEPCDRFFVFARWTLGERYYAICLDPSEHHGKVVVVGDSLHVIADSFTEFARLYVANSMSLYRGGPVISVSSLECPRLSVHEQPGASASERPHSGKPTTMPGPALPARLDVRTKRWKIPAAMLALVFVYALGTWYRPLLSVRAGAVVDLVLFVLLFIGCRHGFRRLMAGLER